ncbi:CDP-glucose 4,6-dehydratase [Oceanomicrobium pacificus]|uniref:CDP-glucose 4,6-dehydratase n=1 Tax=Oceanomicrobium pacificus TaxID=2692916 RepID=A0A6B0U2H7_9RHOB|nr:CDP-glucose 4,6-dehydratase [Oceanomicrobium pacificus]MXU65221.1 CDP-glucose 4,6-dehydratase [Oceanomicrobium pacificus]
MAAPTPFDGAFAGRHVLLTGQTGFKGGWLAAWLVRLGAQVTAVALPPEDGPGYYRDTGIEARIDSRFADINDRAALAATLDGVEADLVIHMAAQALVRDSYADPVGTFMTNVMGTAHVLEEARRMPTLRGVVVVSSDKCYENREWVWGYRENDPMGGADPYSASKGCTELLAASWRRSFFSDSDGPRLASARAGNVFGGGDWARDRLIPDIVRAAAAGTPVALRNPESKRPWQHVLEPLSGYLQLSAALLAGGERADAAATGWNFGPGPDAVVPVSKLTEAMCAAWGAGAPQIRFADETDAPHEAKILQLDSTKAITELGWRPRLTLREAAAMTAEWYAAHAGGQDMAALSDRQIAAFEERMTHDPR